MVVEENLVGFEWRGDFWLASLVLVTVVKLDLIFHVGLEALCALLSKALRHPLDILRTPLPETERSKLILKSYTRVSYNPLNEKADVLQEQVHRVEKPYSVLINNYRDSYRQDGLSAWIVWNLHGTVRLSKF